MTTLMERTPEEHVLEATAPAAPRATDGVIRTRWIAGALLIAGLVLAIANIGIAGTVVAALALGTASALMVFDPASERHFVRSGR